MSGNKRGSSFDILFDQDQEYSNTKRMKFDSTKKSDLIKAEQIESTNMQHIQPNSGATMLEPMTSSEQILLKEIDDISNTDLLLEESFYSPMFKIRTTDQGGPSPFQCSLCPEVFKFYASLLCHLKVVHENPERNYEDKNEVKMEPLEEFRDFPCDFCEATFPNNIQRLWHTRNSHGIQNVYDSKKQEPKRKKVKLKIILKKSGASKKGIEAAKDLKKQLIEMKRQSLENHFQMANDVNPNIFQCSFCSDHKPVNQLKKLESHMSSIHPESYKTKPGLLCLACSDSKSKFNSIQELYEHVQSMHPIVYQPFRCQYCRFGTKLRDQWIYHKLTEHGTMHHFKCERCNIKCFTEEEMKNHEMREHPKTDSDSIEDQDGKKEGENQTTVDI